MRSTIHGVSITFVEIVIKSRPGNHVDVGDWSRGWVYLGLYLGSTAGIDGFVDILNSGEEIELLGVDIDLWLGGD